MQDPVLAPGWRTYPTVLLAQAFYLSDHALWSVIKYAATYNGLTGLVSCAVAHLVYTALIHAHWRMFLCTRWSRHCPVLGRGRKPSCHATMYVCVTCTVQFSFVHYLAVESYSVPSSPVESSRVQSIRVQSSPVEYSRVQSSRVQSSPVHSSPVQSSPLEARPVQSSSSPVQYHIVQDRIVQRSTVQSRLVKYCQVQSSTVQSCTLYLFPYSF
jgi:hypothetical protein